MFGAGKQADNYKAQAKQDEINAQIARDAAVRAGQEANANEDAQRRQTAVRMGAQTASLAENGMIGSQTGADLVADSALNAELDALNIRYAGKLKQQGFYQEADNFARSAQANRKNAKGAIIGGLFSAGSQALTSYGNYQMGQAGKIRAGSLGG
jgi:hypothetical protein